MIEDDIATVWEALEDWAETSLGGRIGQGRLDDEHDDEHEHMWSPVCVAMANLRAAAGIAPKYEEGPAVLTMVHTAKALREYDAGAGRRDAGWGAVEKESDVAICQAADDAALTKLQFAYWMDTRDRNSLKNCLHCTVSFMRMVAEIHRPNQSTGE